MMPKCSHCSENLPAGFMGLYCPKCGKSLWSGIPESSNEEEKDAETPYAIQRIPVYEPIPEESGSDSTPEEPVPGQQPAMGYPIRRMEAEPLQIQKSCPWEDRDEIGAIRGFLQTIGQCVFHPGEFFGKLPPKGGFGDPMLFAMIMGLLSAIIGFIWSLGFDFLGSQLDIGFPMGGAADRKETLFINGAVIVLTPMIIVPFMFLSSAVYHVFLLLLRGGKNGYEATFRTTCYTLASNIWGMVPLCGPFISALWGIALMTIGYSKVHEISFGKALAAVLLPLILLILSAIGFMVLMVFLAIGL